MKKFYLMKKKGVFPYDFFDDVFKLTSEEEMEFPSRSTFFNKLADEECSMKVSSSPYLASIYLCKINDHELTFRLTWKILINIK